MGRLFGTDGARGVAITELTCETAMQIGKAAAIVLTKKTKHKPTIFIGKDTRISSDVLEAALAAGICSVGANAEILGVVPTPAVAALVEQKGADAGVMISASHNSFEFNGIMKSIKGNLTGLRIAIDCANGSASATAKRLFEGLGANVYVINSSPDGTNINDNCGSTHIGNLMQFVVDKKCHAGLAFDGDADRCLAVDEKGQLIDGDKLMAICAKAYKEQGKLKKNTAVVTVMSNLGFTYFAKNNGIKMQTTKVGDRYVLEKMLDGGYNLGGEQSGHIIFLDEANTGDGQLSGAKVLEILAESGKKMSELASVMEHYPQVMINVKISPRDREVWKNDSQITDLIEHYENELGDSGRILVRESGTEPLIRVMLEGKDFKQINEYAIAISEKIKERAGR